MDSAVRRREARTTVRAAQSFQQRLQSVGHLLDRFLNLWTRLSRKERRIAPLQSYPNRKPSPPPPAPSFARHHHLPSPRSHARLSSNPLHENLQSTRRPSTH